MCVCVSTYKVLKCGCERVMLPKVHADRVAACSELEILVASCGFEASTPGLCVGEQLTFKSLQHVVALRGFSYLFLTPGENVYVFVMHPKFCGCLVASVLKRCAPSSMVRLE